MHPKEAEINKLAQAKMAYESGGNVVSGLAGCNSPVREGLTARLRSDRNQSLYQAKRLDQLHELIFLLEKNPEVARILDLLDELGQR